MELACNVGSRLSLLFPNNNDTALRGRQVCYLISFITHSLDTVPLTTQYLYKLHSPLTISVTMISLPLVADTGGRTWTVRHTYMFTNIGTVQHWVHWLYLITRITHTDAEAMWSWKKLLKPIRYMAI